MNVRPLWHGYTDRRSSLSSICMEIAAESIARYDGKKRSLYSWGEMPLCFLKKRVK